MTFAKSLFRAISASFISCLQVVTIFHIVSILKKGPTKMAHGLKLTEIVTETKKQHDFRQKENCGKNAFHSFLFILPESGAT